MWLSHKLYALYVHREITDAGYAVPPICWRRGPEISSIPSVASVRFWRRCSIRNSLFCPPDVTLAFELNECFWMFQQGIGFMLSNPISVILTYCSVFVVSIFKNIVAAFFFCFIKLKQKFAPKLASFKCPHREGYFNLWPNREWTSKTWIQP